MRMVWTGLQLRMKLRSHEPRMVLYLYDFHQAIIRQSASNYHASLRNLLTEGIVELIAMTMALANHLLPIGSKGIGILLHLARICPQAHGAALVLHVYLRSHQIDDRILGLGVKLSAVGTIHAADMAGKLDNGTLHAKAQPQERQLVLTGILDCLDLALNTAVTKAARHQDALAACKLLIHIHIGILQLFGVHPVNFHSSIIINPCMMKCLCNGNIGIRQLHIFADYGNLDLLLREYKLSNAELSCLRNGEPLTVIDSDEEMTMGIDLKSRTGIRFCMGDTQKWQQQENRQWEKYNFGLYGCWHTDDDGNLNYTQEEDYSEEMWNELKKKGQRQQEQHVRMTR